MFLKATVRITLVLGALIVPAAAHAQIYNNGPPSSNVGNIMTRFIQAQDFSFAQTYNVTGIRFWAWQSNSSLYAGSITWRIYGNNAGAPDDNNVLFEALTAVTPVIESVSGNRTEFLSFNIPTDFSLGAGTYWLGLHNGPLSLTNIRFFAWQHTASNGTLSGHEQEAPFDSGNWRSTDVELAFQLFGQPSSVVPEPGTLALTALGLLGMVATRRRRAA